ncbi:MAG TPA: PHP domain-containing protein [Blastocatellia bacterium]|nr:PHP domain-containing protein [Blastocatellia bacterium]
MREFKADLHIHTCLSPCADLEMSPRQIVSAAKRRGLDVIGICDHNSAENVPAVARNAAREGITVIGGMEVTSREEVHILALFDKDDDLFSLQEIVYEHLHGTNDEKLYGEQVIVNEEEEIIGFSNRLLIGATELTTERLVDLIHERDGLAIAAHVDREGFGIIGQLGFIPEGLPLDALELADPTKRAHIPLKNRLPFITSSDAHKLEDVGRRTTTFLMKTVTLQELRRCLSGEEGRIVRI